MVGWTRRNRESREREAHYRKWRSEQSPETLERHDLRVRIENRMWNRVMLVGMAVSFAAMLLSWALYHS